MFCPACGKELPDGASFCSKCGTKIQASGVAQPNRGEQPAQQVQSATQQPQQVQSVQSAAVTNSATSGAVPTAQQPVQKLASNKRRNISIVAVAVVVVAVIVGIVGYNVWQNSLKEQVEERTAQIQETVDGITQEADSLTVNTGEGADRVMLLQQYAICATAKAALESEQQQGNFDLPNGTKFDIAPEIDSLDQIMGTIRAWFEANYQQSLNAASFADGDTADSLSSATCQQRIDALTALKSTIDQEKAIWSEETGAGSTYANLIAAIDAQITRGNELLPQIAAREEEEAKNARGFIGSWAWSSTGGGAPMINVITFYDDGRFLSQTRFTQETSTWSIVGQASDGRVTLQTDPSTYTYNPSTDTLVTGDGSMTFTRSSGPIG